ncbi:MAG: response regulator transcription factor [Cyanobacteria bacterium HKST-UBA04]|nr:response regulator transcription factor [Cyanobacteria bacterium HKST-UBA04]MCA9840732.1 response regulator transcription factor [Cyanobacteria bacterium HKST-UBA03]
MATIVAVDDDPSILELVKVNLEIQGHEVVTAPDGEKGYALVQQHHPQLVVLDVMMPGTDGYTVCQRIRKNDAIKETPVLMLTALGVVDDKVKGFDAGADDYLVKPFEIPELMVRVRALLRRYTAETATELPEILSVGDITLIPENLEVKIDDQISKLTPTEFEILNCLVQSHGQAISLGQLLKDVWGYNPDDDVETIRVHVRHLRSKLEKIQPEKKYIETIYGGGYRLHPEGLNK